jgi:hypothetical protein
LKPSETRAEAPTPNQVRAAREYLIRTLAPDGVTRATPTAALDRLKMPTSLPAIDRLRVEEDRSTSVAAYSPLGDTSEQKWARFSRDGTLEGKLVIPRNQRLMKFTRGRVVVGRPPVADGFILLQVHRVVSR